MSFIIFIVILNLNCLREVPTFHSPDFKRHDWQQLDTL